MILLHPQIVLQGDNLTLLRDVIPAESVDLIYLDPPFLSEKQYSTLQRGQKGGEKKPEVAFNDTWRWNEEAGERYEACRADSVLRDAIAGFRLLCGEGSMLSYLTMMAPRLIELHRVLAPTGSLYLHCDRSAVAHLKILLDCIFGTDNHLATVVWCYGLGGSSHRRWPSKHDDILWYAKVAGKQTFNPVMVPATSNRMKGKLKKAPDYWMIPSINNMARERCGYPTQKPLILLERIILASSNEGGIVLDPFCGSGTTLVAAARLKRYYIGMDWSALAIETANKRLSEVV